MPTQLQRHVEDLVPAAIELAEEHVQLVAGVGDLVAELVDRVPGHASLSFIHRTSSFSVWRVSARGLVTMCRQPT
jgi:hypothetical protein